MKSWQIWNFQVKLKFLKKMDFKRQNAALPPPPPPLPPPEKMKSQQIWTASTLCHIPTLSLLIDHLRIDDHSRPVLARGRGTGPPS